MSSLSRLLCCLTLLTCYPATAEEPAGDPASQTPPPAEAQGETPTEAVTITRPPLDERSEQDASALQARLAEREQQQLQAADETFLALWLAANVGEPAGSVILLPADNLHPDSPDVAGPLRRKLPDAGWNSLSISLPDPLSDLPPPREAAVQSESAASSDAATPASEAVGAEAGSPPVADTEAAAQTAAATAEPASSEQPAADSDTAAADAEAAAAEAAEAAAASARQLEEARTAHEQRIFARIDAALAFAKARHEGSVVLLGQGSGGYWAARYVRERNGQGVQRLLLVSAEVPAGFAPPLDELAPALSLPVGDFFYRDSQAQRRGALLRLQASKRLKASHYQQVALKSLPGAPEVEQEQLYRRLRGWLSPTAP